MNSFLRFGAVAAFAVAVVGVGANPAMAAGAQLTVNPATGVTDGQSLAVTGTGFQAGAQVSIAECLNSATTRSCNVAGGDDQVATADASGAISVSLPARRTFQGADPATGASTGAVDCSTAPGCVIVAASGTSADAAPVQISFG